MKLREKTTATILIALFMISAMTFAVSVNAKKEQETIEVWWLEDAERYGGDGTPLGSWTNDRIPPSGSIEFRVTGKAYHGDMALFYNYPLENFESCPLVIANGKFAAWARYTSPVSGLPILDKIRGKLEIDEGTAYGSYVQYGYAFGDYDTVRAKYPNLVATDEDDMWLIGITYYTVHGKLGLGDWILDFGGPWVHDMKITDCSFVDGTFSFSGTGGYPSDGPYSHPWTVTGTVSGDAIDFTIVYGPPHLGYTVLAKGTIETAKDMKGKAQSSIGQEFTWTATYQGT